MFILHAAGLGSISGTVFGPPESSRSDLWVPKAPTPNKIKQNKERITYPGAGTQEKGAGDWTPGFTICWIIAPPFWSLRKEFLRPPSVATFCRGSCLSPYFSTRWIQFWYEILYERWWPGSSHSVECLGQMKEFFSVLNFQGGFQGNDGVEFVRRGASSKL